MQYNIYQHCIRDTCIIQVNDDIYNTYILLYNHNASEKRRVHGNPAEKKNDISDYITTVFGEGARVTGVGGRARSSDCTRLLCVHNILLYDHIIIYY